MSSGESGQINGWYVKYQPDFVKFYSSSKYLDRLNLGGPSKAKKIIEDKVHAICNSANPGSSTYPKLGNMKWLKARKGVKIQEERLSGDYRILFLPTNPMENELTFFAIKTHTGVQEFLRDAHARVHNAAMDEFSIEKWEEDPEYSVDMSREDAEETINKIQQHFENILGEDEIENNQREFIDVSRTCSIYRLGKYGIELDPSPEQLEHINSPSPMLLPGVAGTGKSTVLQYRYRNAVLSYGNDVESFFDVGIYLTLNKPLAKSTRREVKKILSPDLASFVDTGILDINSWVSALLGEETAISTPNLTFETFRKWWSKRQHLKKYDPAQAWEEYRGVIKGTAMSIEYPDGALNSEAYVGLPHDRCAYEKNERMSFFNEVVTEFQHWRKESNVVWYDDQDLIQKVKEMSLPPLYKHIFIDEVQDLTELQLQVIMEMLKPSEKCICSRRNKACNCPPSCENCRCQIFDVTGDLSQQVYPTRFRWEDTSRAIFESQGIKCHKRTPMSTSYRSVRSIVDLSSYYLDNMESEYRQGGDITQAQSEQKAETPTVLEETEARLYEILHKAKLPAAHCPIIVRSEEVKRELEHHLKERVQQEFRQTMATRFSESKDVQNEEYEKNISEQESRISSYILTIAEAKGLEWNNVVLWEISSGSDHLLEKKLHEQRGKYIEKTDWNYQLELRHAFVATTRARLLLLHLGKKRNEENPFYDELQRRELIVIEKKPVDLSRFSKSELTTEEYEEMAEDYANKEMYGAAALIYKNNLNNPQRANEMDYWEAKKKQNAILMAQHLTSYERDWNGESLGDVEKKQVLEMLNDNGEDTELGYVIEIANMLGLENRAKMAELKRMERLASVFESPEIYSQIASEYENLGENEKSGDFYKKATENKMAISQWWRGKAFEKAWKEIIRILAPNEGSLEHELLLISLLKGPEVDKDERTLFDQIFGIKINKASQKSLVKMNVSIGSIEFYWKESKQRVLELVLAELSVKERAFRYLKQGSWELGLALYLEDEQLDLGDGLKFCADVSEHELLEWYKKDLEKGNPNSTQARRLAFFRHLFSRKFDSKFPIHRVEKFLKGLNLKEAKRPNIGAGSNLQKWHHALYCVNEPQNANLGTGKANVSALVRWYVNDDTLKNNLLLHTIRCAIFSSLKETYANFEKISRRTLSTKVYIKEALIVAELYIKALMNPRRYSHGNYPKIRKALIGSMKHTDVPDFVDVWFDFFLDMQPDKNLLDKQTQVKRDIQIVFPLFKDRVNGFNHGLPGIGLYPDDSLTRRYDGGEKSYSFSKDGLAILKRKEYTRGQENAVDRIIDESNDGADNLMAIYIDEMILKPNKNIKPRCFFELIEEFLAKQSSTSSEEIETEQMTSDVEEVDEEDETSTEDIETLEEVESEISEEVLIEDDEEITDQNIDDSPTEESVEGESGQKNEFGILTPPVFLEYLHRDSPEDVASWFSENYKSFFNAENTPLIMGCYTMFIERLEKPPQTFDETNLNEWLCFDKILNVMRTEFNFPGNPYTANQRMGEQLQEVRRKVATDKSISKNKTTALIKIK